jgi:hypothetical protein
MSKEWMKNVYFLITYYLLLITSESPTVHGGENVKCWQILILKILHIHW